MFPKRFYYDQIHHHEKLPPRRTPFSCIFPAFPANVGNPALFLHIKKPLESCAFKGLYWRRAWDSNPRYPESTTDFEDDGYRNSLLFLLLSFYICPPANPVISTASVYRHITFYIILSHRFIGYGCTFPSFLHGLYFTGSPFFLSNSFFGINCLSGIIAS